MNNPYADHIGSHTDFFLSDDDNVSYSHSIFPASICRPCKCDSLSRGVLSPFSCDGGGCNKLLSHKIYQKFQLTEDKQNDTGLYEF